jgi:hypothetical protein
VGKIVIPENIKQEISTRIDQFNKKYRCEYIPCFKKDYLYLDRDDRVAVSHICRLKYKGKADDWDFAIFKYSDEQYDEAECFFPGAECLDGTVEGAMLAGIKAYPF